jgi:polyhydroxyalkanoate synthesis regulator phasin
MLELLRKAALAGLGIVTLKEEKVREIINDLIEQGELSKEEGNQFFGEMRERVDRNRSELEGKIGEMLKRALDKMSLPSKEELNRLAEGQKELVSRIERLERERGEGVGKTSPGSG